MSWQLVNLSEVADVDWGNTSITKASYVDNGFPAFSATGQDGYLPKAEHFVDGIVLSAIGARCGKCFLASGEWTAIKNTITIIPNQAKINLSYLYALLNDESSWQTKGAAQPFITLGIARNRKIPLPPIAEQQRIAVILDKATEIKAKREQVLENLKTLKVSLFLESVTTSRKNLINLKVGDVIEQVRGVTYSSGDSINEYKDGYVELLRANNIFDGDLNFDDLVFVPKEKVSDRQYLKENDIIIAASSGSLSVVGKAAPFHGSRLTSFGAFCKVLRPKINVDARFIANYFQTKEYRQKVSSLAEGANINNLRNEHIDNLDIQLPELHEQQRIADINAYIDLQINLTRTAIRLNADMIASLQHQAFTTGFNA